MAARAKGGIDLGQDGTSDKIFVGGLPPNSSTEMLLAYFARYGTIVHAEVKVEPATGRTRGFGFVQFDCRQVVDEIIRDYATHTIEGKWIEVKRAIPQGYAPPPQKKGSPGTDFSTPRGPEDKPAPALQKGRSAHNLIGKGKGPRPMPY